MTETQKHKSLYAALAAAQAEMGRALKDSSNPHFKSKYADLASVMDACMPALTKNGIAVLQPAFDEGGERFVKTIFVHGESGETAECRVPLIVSKNDMQGYGSAVTYARRYGLMGMAGIAPEDDDGHAAAKSPPRQDDAPPQPKNPDAIRDSLIKVIRSCENADQINTAIGSAKFDAAWQWLAENHETHSADVRRAVDEARAKFEAKPAADLGGDNIPDFPPEAT